MGLVGMGLVGIELAGMSWLAGTTGLEPATSDVTGRRSNQLNYVPALCRICYYDNMHAAPGFPDINNVLRMPRNPDTL